MPGDLPSLTKRQLDRLVEIGTKPNDARTDLRPAATSALISGGLAILGDVMWVCRGVVTRKVCLTPLGVRVLAGLPGPEFGRFREMVARVETEAVPCP